MTIAILETGRPPKALIEPFGTYDAMFRRLLGAGFEYETFSVFDRHYPGDPDGWEGMVITGSPAGAYDDRPWIAPLEDYLRACAGKTRLLGVCFGHQILAQAFGGVVIKSPKARANGLHTYALTDGFTIEGETLVSAPASHGDQVIDLPPRARLLGGNDFCPNGMIEYPFGAASLQFHPEFEPPFAKALIEVERGVIGDAKADAAIASLDQPNDNALLGRWMAKFLRT